MLWQTVLLIWVGSLLFTIHAYLTAEDLDTRPRSRPLTEFGLQKVGPLGRCDSEHHVPCPLVQLRPHFGETVKIGEDSEGSIASSCTPASVPAIVDCC